MLRSTLTSLCRFLLRIFFRRIEVVGKHNLPDDGALLFALNHPSGLVDPLFILCLSGRRVSFLAKAPLFRTPVVGIFVKAFECLPVYRAADGADPQKNRAMMKAAAELLAKGNALALFPEGTSHSDATLKRFRSGAARIALSARALGRGPVRIVPAALYYERKQTFRSRAVLSLGPPLQVPLVTLDESGESPIEHVQKLTSQLQGAIFRIMPTAESADALVLSENAERVLSAALRDSPEQCREAARSLLPLGADSAHLSLAERMARRRHLLDRYSELVERMPQDVTRLIESIQLLQDDLQSVGLAIDAAPGTPYPLAQRMTLVFWGIALFPLSVVGWLLHAPAYQLVRWLAFRYSDGQTDVTATVKLLAGMLLFPVTWGLLGFSVGWHLDRSWGLLALAGGPLFGWSTIRAMEIWSAVTRATRIKRRARRAGLEWPAIVARRAHVAREMARLVSTT